MKGPIKQKKKENAWERTEVKKEERQTETGKKRKFENKAGRN